MPCNDGLCQPENSGVVLWAVSGLLPTISSQPSGITVETSNLAALRSAPSSMHPLRLAPARLARSGVGTPQLGPFEVCVLKIDTLKVGGHQYGPFELRTQQVGLLESGSHQHGSTEVGA